jgi:hypothetical protein
LREGHEDYERLRAAAEAAEAAKAARSMAKVTLTYLLNASAFSNYNPQPSNISDRLEETRENIEILKKIQQTKADQMKETRYKMTEIESSIASEESVLQILKVCIKCLADTTMMWKTLIKFFEDIRSKIACLTYKVF